MPVINNIPTTQYIGPKIIPHLWDPILWDSTIQYDALAVVQYNGAGYISRFIPPIGTNPSDTEYWVKWSDFNAQLAQVQQQVYEYNQLIDSKADRTELQTAIDHINEALETSVDSLQTSINDNVTALESEIAEKVDTTTFDAALNELMGRLAPTKNLGVISDYRFHLRPPVDFTISAFLSAAALDMQDFAANQWSYGYNTNSTIPLLNNSPSYEVLNAAGSIVSCSTFVVDSLYKAGYTDLQGLSHFMTGPLRNLTEYLTNKGWTKIENLNDLRAGDIVATSWRNDSNALYYPGHTFIYAGNGMKYDTGSQTLIQNGVPTACNWNTGLNQLYRTLDNGLYAVQATKDFQYSDNAEELLDWKVLVIANDAWVENLDRNGKHVTQIAWNTYATIIKTTEDNAINWKSARDERMQRLPFAAINPDSNTYDANISTIPFTGISGSAGELYELQTDGSVKINTGGVYRIACSVEYTSSITDGVSSTAQSVVIIQQDHASGSTYHLCDNYRTLMKKGSIYIERIVQLNTNDIISAKFGLFNTSTINATISQGPSRTRLELFKMA